MPSSPNTLLRELRASLQILTRHHAELSYLDVPALSQMIRQDTRYLQLPEVRTERLRRESKLADLMIRAKGSWISRHDAGSIPDWLKSGKSRQRGLVRRSYFRQFFIELKKNPKITQDLTRILGLSFAEFKKIHRRWQMLLTREDRYAEEYPLAVQRLRSLLLIVRGALMELKSKSP